MVDSAEEPAGVSFVHRSAPKAQAKRRIWQGGGDRMRSPSQRDDNTAEVRE